MSLSTLLLLVLGAVIGMILTTLFQKPLDRIWDRIRQRVYGLFRTPSQPHPPETFALGKRSFQFLVIDGDGQHVYKPQTVTTKLSLAELTLPAEVQQLKSAIAAREEKKKSDGHSAMWNGPTVALERYAISRTIPQEDLEIALTFQPSDYFTFQATIMSLDLPLSGQSGVTTLRERYLAAADPSVPVPFLAQLFGVTIVVFSKDEQEVILCWRSAESGVRPGELDVTFCEGVHPTLDRAAREPTPDLYRTAIRGASEEMGLDLYEDDITFLGFGLDTQYYQWQMLGMARLRTSIDEAFQSRGRGTAGKWETRKFEVCSADPKKLFCRIQGERLWSVAWVAIYWSLVKVHGRASVDRVVREVFGSG